MHTIAVSNKVNEEEKIYYTNFFKDKARLYFLNGLLASEQTKLLLESDILIARNPTLELPNVSKEAFQNIRFVQLLSAGYDHLNPEMFPSHCKVAGNMGAYAIPMAEHTVGMIIALAKDFLLHHHEMQQGIFIQFDSRSTMVSNKTCGILGFGGIGKKVADIMQRAFQCKIYAINTSGKTDRKVDWIGTLNDLDFLLKESDFLVITIPLTKETENLIGAKELALLKNTAILINVARGQIVNEKALFEKLKATPTFKAGIDCWWIEPFFVHEFKMKYPFLELPNVLGSPHNSAMVEGMLLRSSELGCENVQKYLEGREVERLLDLSNHQTFYF
jgi:glycerate dehydrogenase